MARKTVYAATYMDYDDFRVLGLFTSYVDAAIAAGMLNEDASPKLRLPENYGVEAYVVYDTAAEARADREGAPDTAPLYIKHIYDPMISAQNVRKSERDAARREDIEAGR